MKVRSSPPRASSTCLPQQPTASCRSRSRAPCSAATEGSFSVGAAGAGSGNFIYTTVQALISGGSSVTSGNGQAVLLTANDYSNIEADAGGLSLGYAGGDAGASVALGAAAAVNEINNTVLSSVNDSTVTSASSLNITATTGLPTQTFNPSTAVSGNLITLPSSVQLATGDAVSYSDGGGGNSPIGGLSNDTTYYVIVPNAANPNQIELADNLADAAKGTAIPLTSDGTGSNHSFSFTGEKIFALALGISGALAAGGDVGVGIAGAGSGSNNQVNDNVQATIVNCNTASSSDSHTITTQNGGGVFLTANDGAEITAAAGAVAVAIGAGSVGASVAIGVSVSINSIGSSSNPGEVEAQITNSVVSASGGVSLDALSTSSILAVTVAGGVSVGVGESTGVGIAAAGAGSQNTTNVDIEALINNGSNVTTHNSDSVTLTAMDNSSIEADAGGLGLGFAGGDDAAVAGALGAGAAVNGIENTIEASIQGSTVTSAANVALTATTLDAQGNAGEQITTLALGIAGSLAVGGEGIGFGLAGAGAGTSCTIDNTINASITSYTSGTTTTGSTVHAPDGTVTLAATDGALIKTSSGAVAIAIAGGVVGGGAVGVGVSVADDTITNTVMANINDSSVNTESVSEEASEQATIQALTIAGAAAAAGGAVGIAASGAGADSVNQITDDIEASITDGSDVTTTTSAGVSLSATDTATITSSSGGAALSIAIGGAGAGAIGLGISIAENEIGTSPTNENKVKAFIDDSTVNTSTGSGTISLGASSTASITTLSLGAAISVAFTGAGGAAAASGGAATATNYIYNDIQADIQNDSQVTSGGAVTSTATDGATIQSDAVGAAIAASVGEGGVAVAVAVSIAMNTIGDTVEAYVGEADETDDTTQVTAPSVTLNATSTQMITDVAVAASVSASISIGASCSGSGASENDSTSSTIAAFIDGGATVDTTGAVLVESSDSAAINSTTGADTLSIGLAGISAGVSILDDTMGDTVKSYIGAAMVTSSAGDVTVMSTSTATMIAFGQSTSVSITIGGAGDGIQTTATDSMVTEAYLATGANVTADSGGLSVTSQSTPYISAQSDGGAGGIVAIGVTETTADLEGATKAYIGEGVTVNTGAGGISVSSTESEPTGQSNPDAVTASTTLVAIGLGGVEVMNATAEIGYNGGDNVEAFLGPEAGTTPTNSLSTLTTSGALLVSSNSTTTANANSQGGGGGGIDVGVSYATTYLDGTTQSYAGGKLNLTASSTTLMATSTNTGTASTLIISIAAIGGDGANITADDARDTFAYIESGAMVTVTSNGAMSLNATSSESTTATANGGSGGVVAVSVLYSSAEDSGETEAYVGSGASVSAGSLSVVADAKKQDATANSFVLSIGLAAGAGANTTATTDGTTAAYVGDVTGTVPPVNALSTTLSITGEISVEAESQAVPSVNVTVGAGGAIAGDGATATATDEGTTEAYFGPTADVTLAGSIAITATSLSDPNEMATVGSGGLLAGSGGTVTVNDESTTNAFLDNGVTITNSGTITISATSNSGGSSNLTIGSGGVIQVGVDYAYAYDTETTSAYLGTGVHVTGSGGLIVTAMATDSDSASGTASGGGVFSGSGGQASASDTPTIGAYMVGSDTVNVGGNIAVTADSVSAESHATDKAFGGGAIEVGIPDANATTGPTVTAYVGSTSSITAGGNISLNSEELSQPNPNAQTFTNNIQDVYTDTDTVADTTPDSVVFPEHGLQTGDLVLYVAGSPSSITLPGGGGLQNDRTLKVVAIDANTLQFGDIYQAKSIANGLDPFFDGSGIDTTDSIIDFGSPDYFEDGDAVQYFTVQGYSSFGLSTGTTYYVRPISPDSIEIYTTKTAATTTDTFNPTNVGNGDEIYPTNASSLTANEQVTVLPQPAPFLFPYTDVDVNTGNGDADVGAHNIYVGPSSGFTLEEPVIYQSDGTPLNVDGSPTTTLSTSTIYYAVPYGTNDDYIQLADSPTDAEELYIDDNIIDIYSVSPIAIDNTHVTGDGVSWPRRYRACPPAGKPITS